MCYKQGILKSLESLSGKRGKKNPHNSGLGGEHGSFLANKKKNVGENVRPSKLLYSQNPEPRLVVLGEKAPRLLATMVFFSILTIHFPNRHAANSNETQSSESPSGKQCDKLN